MKKPTKKAGGVVLSPDPFPDFALDLKVQRIHSIVSLAEKAKALGWAFVEDFCLQSVGDLLAPPPPVMPEEPKPLDPEDSVADTGTEPPSFVPADKVVE